LGVVQSDPAQRGELLSDGQNADRVEIQAPELDIAGQRSRRYRSRRKTELSQVEIAAFNGKFAVELVAAIKLVTGVAVVSRP